MSQIIFESPGSDALAPYGHASREPLLDHSEDRVGQASRGVFCNPCRCLSAKKIFGAVIFAGAAVGVLFLLSNPAGWMIAAVAVGAFAVGMILGQIDLMCGLAESRTVRAIAMVGIALIILFLLTNPARWMIAAVAVGTFVLSMIAQMAIDKCTTGSATGKLFFEYTAFGRACRSNDSNYHRIMLPNAAGSLFLGSLPNRLTGFGRHLVEEENVEAVLSVNEPWEREPFGVSVPYSESDWNEIGVDFLGLDVRDHHYLSFEQLDRAADFIHQYLNEGKNVYVHCRAGQGRSAMAIGAYLIKYQKLKPGAAAARIKAYRAISTIHNKIPNSKHGERGLYAYYCDLQHRAIS